MAHHGITIDTGDQDEDPDLRKDCAIHGDSDCRNRFSDDIRRAGPDRDHDRMFTFIVSRLRQRTIRMMVEKGQPVPAELLAPPRERCGSGPMCGVALFWTMVGLGVMIFFGAVNDWEGGAWSLG